MSKPDPLQQIKYLWHFTHRRNVDSIKKHGLLCLAQLKAKGIDIPAPGGNDLSHSLDENCGLDHYVHLGFISSHPMLKPARDDGRIVDTAFLRIDPVVLTWGGTLFAPDVANKNGVPLHSIAEAAALIDFEILYTRTDWSVPEIQARRQRAERCEILVPDAVPMKFITIIGNG